jgi:uncharacterized OsmC-like protein
MGNDSFLFVRRRSHEDARDENPFANLSGHGYRESPSGTDPRAEEGVRRMPTMKKTQVQATLGEKFAMEAKIRDHVVRIDQPKMSGGQDAAPTPLEYYFVSIAGCLGTLGRIIANQKKIPLRSMEVTVEGEVDVEVLLGKSEESRTGFQSIVAKVKIDADMTREEKEEFLHEVDRRCPVSENTLNTTPMRVELVE